MNLLKGKDTLSLRANRRIFGLAVALIVLAVVLGTAANRELSEVGDEVHALFQEHDDAIELHEEFDLVVTNLRAHLAYDNPEFLRVLEAERREFDANLAAAHPWINAVTYAELNAMWSEYEELVEITLAYKEAGDEEAIDRLSSERTTPVIERTSELFEAMLERKKQRLVDLMNYSSDISVWMTWGIMAFAVAKFGMIAWILHRFFRKSVIEPLSVLGNGVERLGQGDYVRLPEFGRQDEIGALYAGFNYMIGELEQRREELESSNIELSAQRDELEAQNEEIIAQQDEQERTLRMLTERERDLELISKYQERLSGYTEMDAFLAATVPALLYALQLDAALVVTHAGAHVAPRLIYSVGYPGLQSGELTDRLFGPAQRVFEERTVISVQRTLAGDERGLHRGYEEAVDHYCPLFDDKRQPIGFLLLTGYGRKLSEGTRVKIAGELVKQFSIAFYAQVLNEERRKQAVELELLNAELETEQQRLKEQRDLVEGIVESIHEGLVMCEEGTVRFANPRIAAFFGLELERGASMEELCKHLERNSGGTLHSLCRRMESLSGQQDELELRFSFARDGDAAARHYELYAGLLEASAASEQLLLVFRDRTEEEKADEAKNEFVSIVSHELRTPLSSIMGFMEILLHRDVAKERQRKYLETVYKESQRLSHLIGDFLDLQRMESGKQNYHFVPIAIAPWLRELAADWKGEWPHRLELSIDAEAAYVNGDADRLTQVMHNLISNAMKYSPGKDKVDVRLFADEGDCWIEVTDYGLGIPEEAREKLFTKFYRVDNSDRRQIGGTGLGLSIVKEIVESHEGRLEYESALGAGSTFLVKLPLYRVPSVAGKIVVVEDDETVSGLIAVAFEKLELSVQSFPTSEAAMLALKGSAEEPPALFIVDIQLAGLKSGWDFIKELDSMPGLASTPMLVTTVLDAPQGFHETPRRRYLQKPFTVERLLQAAKACMGASD
ncbi:ATP-binding protein [Paenibacillus sp. TRM 82003]|nr:ATP-binding protein [Paenibacillus sp. TRM 82003]